MVKKIEKLGKFAADSKYVEHTKYLERENILKSIENHSPFRKSIEQPRIKFNPVSLANRVSPLRVHRPGSVVSTNPR